MGFIIYDLAFLVLFTLWVIWFLHTRKKNLSREGLIYLYKTSLGIKFINYIGGKYKRTLNVAQYFAILIGFILMGGILWVLLFTIYTYIKYPQITQIISAPPVLPLIPYFPKLFGLSSFFPPLYFTYWIIALIVVAFVHEFSHGIFAKFHGIRIKSTGVAFLGPILGAFVEPDERQMAKKKKVAQMSILSAGVFANILTAMFFFIFLWLTFGVAFEAGGILIGGYVYQNILVSDIEKVNGVSFTGEFGNLLDEELIEIKTNEKDYIIPKEILDRQIENLGGEEDMLRLYLDAPAFRNNLVGAISAINNIKITSIEDLSQELNKYSPNEKINLEVKNLGETINYEIILAENPDDSEKAFLGIYLNGNTRRGFKGLVSNTLFFKDPGIFYEESNPFFVFIYYLFWWIVVINFFVALFNMLPVGILDGGRFFYLTMLGIFGSEKTAKQIYKALMYLILGIFILLIFSWLIAL